MRLTVLAVGSLLALAACGTGEPRLAEPSGPSLAVQAPQTGRYVVVYRPHVRDARAQIARHVSVQGARVNRVFQHALRGWSGDLTPAELARLRADPDVAFIEPDAVVSLHGVQNPAPAWGLDRIDQRTLPLSSSYAYNATGTGVRFYGIDTGILYAHQDFGGRASSGYDAITPGGGAADCHGHGTHTASTAAGVTYGVAKSMTVIGVRVLDCSGNGTVSSVVAGVDWVTQNAIRPAVANMSLGGGISAAIDQAVNNSITSGVVYTLSAGNSDLDACSFSPGRVAAGLTVGATTISDARASFPTWGSNYGSCVDLFAPGVSITAGWIGAGNNATNTISGTSMAAPHVAGVAGLYLQGNPTATPAQVATAILNAVTTGAVTNPGAGSPNRLLYSGFIPPPGGNQPPVADFTVDCASPTLQPRQCRLDATVSSDDGGVVPPYTWDLVTKIINTTNPIIVNKWPSVGTYNVTLTVRDGAGLTQSVTKPVVVPPTPGGGNQPPTAQISSPGAGTTFLLGATVFFSGTGNDPETGSLGGSALVWSSSLNGQIGTGTSFSASNLSAGDHTITLTATDPLGATGTASRSITINRPPTASITSPADQSSFPQGASISFSGSGTDPEDGALSGGALVWTSSLNGQIGTGTAFSSSSLALGSHTITLTVTDSDGAVDTETRSVTVTGAAGNQPPVADFTFNCSAAGLQPRQCTLDARSSTDDGGVVPPYTWDLVVKTINTINPQITFKWPAAGTYQVSLTVRDAAGLTNTITKTLVVP